MRLVKSSLLIMVLSLSAIISGAPRQTKNSAPVKRTAPFLLVSDLYRQHARKRGPFYQTHNRALLTKYFTKNLSDLIWKDRVNSKDEVGALDGDPLYNAQDMEIRDFRISEPTFMNEAARVPVSFSNFGRPEAITFVVERQRLGWKIANIEYQDGTNLLGILKGN